MSLAAYTPGNIPTYRFYITTFNPTNTIEVFPLNFLSTSLVYEREPGCIFYRTKFNGKLLFGTNSKTTNVAGNIVNRMDDWTLFWFIEGLGGCLRIDLLITKTVAGVTTDYWSGYFSTSEGTFDVDKCTFEVTPLLDDNYNTILDKQDVEYNMIDIPGGDAPEITTAMTRGGTTYTYTHNRFVMDVLNYIIGQISPGTVVTSTFFSAANNPVTLDVNRMLYVTIAAKYDIKMESIVPASTAATVASMVSFKSLMDILRCLNLYWDYTPFEVRVEHVSFWPPVAGGIDLRSHQLAVASNKYSYTKESMPKYEHFKWIESGGDFLAYPIWYDSECVNQDPGTNTVETSIDATTDIEYIQDIMASSDTEAVIGDEGFVLLANYLDGGNYYIATAETGEGVPPGYPIMFNGDFSWRALHEYYFRHDRVMITGYLNGTLETFYTAKKTKKQDVSVIICEEFEPDKEITSELGETYFAGAKAVVQKGDLEPSGLIKLNLLYGPADNANTGNSPCAGMKVVEVGDAGVPQSTFYFTFTEPVDAALAANPPSVNIVGRDAGGNTCASGWTAGVAVVGSYTMTLVVPWPGVGACVPPWAGPSVCLLQRQVDPGAWDCYEIYYDDTVSC